MPEAPRPKIRPSDRYRRITLWLASAVFLFFVWRFHIPGRGFTALINFGEHNAARYIHEIDAETTHITPQSDGYDSQWYAELAVNPDLGDPRMVQAIDNLPYRARRILFCWTAYGLGLGQPRWVLQAFALQNVIAWLLLGWLITRWLPTTNWGNIVRWLAVMFSFGMVFSVRCSLVDGPGLLLIATGMALLEIGKPWLAALVLGISGLGKETCILSGAALAEIPANRRDWKAWSGLLLRGFLVAAPLLFWTAYIIQHFGRSGTDTGARNFGLPLVEFWRMAMRSIDSVVNSTSSLNYTIAGVFTVVSLGTQVLFFALRPRWRDPWWRVGTAFALLMATLGESVWEGYPSAAARVLLPMLLAFNILVPRGIRWWPVLLLGNLTILSTPNFVRLPVGAEPAVLDVPLTLAQNQENGEYFRSELVGPWLPSEQSLYDTWHWTEGSVELVVHNPHGRPVDASLAFGLNSRNTRKVWVLIEGEERWRGESTRDRRDIRIGNIKLAPGTTRIRFETDRPPETLVEFGDTRPIAFRVFDLRLSPRATGSWEQKQP